MAATRVDAGCEGSIQVSVTRWRCAVGLGNRILCGMERFAKQSAVLLRLLKPPALAGDLLVADSAFGSGSVCIPARGPAGDGIFPIFSISTMPEHILKAWP
jgi:hypothetical protein